MTEIVNVRETTLEQVQKKLDMQEGFNIGLEMLGNAHAFRDMLANLSRGVKVALLGIPSPSESHPFG